MAKDVVSNYDEFYNKNKNKKVVYNTKNESTVIDHVKAANMLIRFIELTPMDDWFKRVMIMRIGNPLINLKSLSYMQIALTLGCMENEVKEIEEEGKKIVNDYMHRVTQPEFIEKFERDRRLKAHVDNTLNKIVNSDKNPTA